MLLEEAGSPTTRPPPLLGGGLRRRRAGLSITYIIIVYDVELVVPVRLNYVYLPPTFIVIVRFLNI